MNSACSTCLESFTSRSNISTIPCGHVFHTFCLENWFNNNNNRCSQCRTKCTRDQIIKLYFSEATSENNLITDLEEENLKLKEDTNESQRQVLKLEEEKLKLEQENLNLKKEKLKEKREKLASQEENVRLKKHIDSLTSKWKQEKKTLKAQISSSNFNPIPGTSADSNPERPAGTNKVKRLST